MSRAGTSHKDDSTPLLQEVPEHSTKQSGSESAETNFSNSPPNDSARQGYGSIGEPDAGSTGGANILYQLIKPGINIIINS